MTFLDKRKIACMRNWNKGRLKNVEAAFKNVPLGPISKEEVEILHKAQKALSAIWEIWDENSKKAISAYYQRSIMKSLVKED